ncbi:MAG: hypothetical protein F6K65_35035 [Moorea sp. SIO3C2]|nr:hypothetical protein [Moorena sp. SIO3C2]
MSEFNSPTESAPRESGAVRPVANLIRLRKAHRGSRDAALLPFAFCLKRICNIGQTLLRIAININRVGELLQL